MTELEQKTYNLWLRTTRIHQNKPYRLRKDFTAFESEEPTKYLQVRRIAKFFERYENIDPITFFRAPYEVYQDADGYYDLQFYSSQIALRCYTVYWKKLRAQPPDSEFQLQEIVRTFKWIFQYCVKHNIELRNYASSHGKVVAPFVQHIKQHHLSLYALLEFPGVFEYLDTMPRDSFELMLTGVDIYELKAELDRSKQAKTLTTRAYQKLEETISHSLKHK